MYITVVERVRTTFIDIVREREREREFDKVSNIVEIEIFWETNYETCI